jgi:hypothetical protein
LPPFLHQMIVEFKVRLNRVAKTRETEAPIEGPSRNLLSRLRVDTEPRRPLGVHTFLRNSLEHLLDKRCLSRLLVQVA